MVEAVSGCPVTCPLYIDDRDGSRDLMKHFDPTIADLCRLDFGDAMIVGNGPLGPVTVGVEVKSISDLLQSANTGRLGGHQMVGNAGYDTAGIPIEGLLGTYDVPYLLYFGSYRPGDDGKLEVRRGKEWKHFRLGLHSVPYIYLESFLMDVSATGVRLQHVYDAREAAIWLMCLHRWWSKQWLDHKGLKQFDGSKDGSLLPGLDQATELKARIAQQLPGIGFDRAVSAAIHFDTAVDMVNAEWQEWATIPKIGKVIAKSVWEALRRK